MLHRTVFENVIIKQQAQPEAPSGRDSVEFDQRCVKV
jgi:hypothetical protein